MCSSTSVTLTVTAGAGGDGAATFRREAHVPRGGPDGGDGGRGGSVYLVVDIGQTTLGDYRFKHHFRATPGGRGEGSRRHGKAGRTSSLPIPPGTVVFDASSGDLLADLVAPGQRCMVARGGRGGLGNAHFATSTHQAPRHAQKGEPGEGVELAAGASAHRRRRAGRACPTRARRTLLAALTAATPRIGGYPFTTLEPNLGVLDLSSPSTTRRTSPDDGGPARAHRGCQRGRRSRARLPAPRRADARPGARGRPGGADPERDFDIIRDELRGPDPRLLEKTTLVVANKMDLPPAPATVGRPSPRRARRGMTGRAIGTRRRPSRPLRRARAPLPDADRAGAPRERRASWSIASILPRRLQRRAADDGAYRVRGRRIERLVAQTDFENDESAERFQRELAHALGVERELVRAGVDGGDTVRIGPHELEWGSEAAAWA